MSAHATPRRGAELGKRATWIIADQALASLANAGLTIGLARVVSPTEYGAFALAFSVYSLVVAISQAVAAQVLVVRYAGADQQTRVRAAAAGAGTAVSVGLAATVVLLTVAPFTGIPINEALAAAGIVLPALLLQDFWRTTFVAFGTPARSFLNDIVWVVLWASCFAVLFAFHVDSAAVFIAAWGGSAVVAGILGARQAHVAPRLLSTKRWLIDHRDVGVPSLANTLAILGAMQLAFLLIAGIGSVKDLGSLRASQTLLGPLNIIGFALSSFAVPEIVRRNFTANQYMLVAAALSGVMVLAGATWGTVLLLLPDSVGHELLGATWDGARTTLPGLIVSTVAIGATTGATAVMRAMNRVRSAFWVSVLLGPLVLICSITGVIIGGAQGAANGFGLAAAIVVIPCWLLLIRDARLGRREVPAAV